MKWLSVVLGVFFLMALLSVHFLINLYWIVLNDAPLPWDPANHIYLSFETFNKLKEFDISRLVKVSIIILCLYIY